MSGYDEIMGWAFELFDPMDYDGYDDWIDDVKQNFLENGRDLDSIFDSDDFTNAEIDFNKARFGEGIPEEFEREEFTSQPVPEIEKPEGIEPIPLFQEEDEEAQRLDDEEFGEEEEEEGIVKRFTNFVRGLFK